MSYFDALPSSPVVIGIANAALWHSVKLCQL